METYQLDMNNQAFNVYINYTNYSDYIGCNDNIYENSLAFQDLNNQNYMQSLTVDLTIEEKSDKHEKEKQEDMEQILQPDSPTQARDFKLFCERCRRCFTSKKRLQNHVEKCHKRIKNEKIREFSCQHCQRAFKKRSGLAKHIVKYHEGNLTEESSRRPSIFHNIDLLAVSDGSGRKN